MSELSAAGGAPAPQARCADAVTQAAGAPQKHGLYLMQQFPGGLQTHGSDPLSSAGEQLSKRRRRAAGPAGLGLEGSVRQWELLFGLMQAQPVWDGGV